MIDRCPSCNNGDVRECEYSEGRILLCGNCALQWAQYRDNFKECGTLKILDGSVFKEMNTRYLARGSIARPERYSPYKSFFKFMSTRNPQKRLRILDVGCGNGVFLQECLRRGHDALGVEANAALRSTIPADIADRIIFEYVEKVESFGEPFDVITFWDSFEHLRSGFKLLEKLRCHLKKGGVIYLRVNNNRDIFNFAALFTLRLFPDIGKKMLRICFGFPHHAWNFSREGMANLLKRNGWKIILFKTGETPPSRLTKNPLLIVMISLGYLCNKAFMGGKIGDYYIAAG